MVDLRWSGPRLGALARSLKVQRPQRLPCLAAEESMRAQDRAERPAQGVPLDAAASTFSPPARSHALGGAHGSWTNGVSGGSAGGR